MPYLGLVWIEGRPLDVVAVETRPCERHVGCSVRIQCYDVGQWPGGQEIAGGVGNVNHSPIVVIADILVAASDARLPTRRLPIGFCALCCAGFARLGTVW